jgi:hypothetical protein
MERNHFASAKIMMVQVLLTLDTIVQVQVSARQGKHLKVKNYIIIRPLNYPLINV